MNNPFQMQPELRYGAPVCDQILTNRFFTVGYSYYFRQPKWTLEIVSRTGELLTQVERLDNFRADSRISHRFRGSLEAYKGSGYDRGHLVASANKVDENLQNSETFLLSNISPQHKDFNRKIWRKLEREIRKLDKRADILETYVLTAPVFYYEKPFEIIGKEDQFGITIPVPHAFIKSVLTEDLKGNLNLWTFLMDAKELPGSIGDYLIKTYDAEELIGGRFWDVLDGRDLHKAKSKRGELWG